MKLIKPILIAVFLFIAVIFAYKTVKTVAIALPAQGEFHGKIVYGPPIENFAYLSQNHNVLGDSTDKRIDVDLSAQRVYAYEGGNRINEFPVSTGLWGRTPTGTFTIQRKVRSQTMSGGNKSLGTYYYLPGVQWVQYFGNSQIPWSRGFSFHGTYWHENFGHPMSHGCVNMRTPDAQWLYEWAPMGTTVSIYGNTPAS